VGRPHSMHPLPTDAPLAFTLRWYRFHPVNCLEVPMGDFETIRYAIDDGLATITLDRSEKRNAVNQAMFTELGDAAEEAAADSAVRAVLVTGEGPTFCAGIDLSLIGELAGLASQASGEERGFHAFVRSAQRPFRSLARMPKPTLAAVQGHAVGAGFQLALACDLRMASVDAKFAMLEPRYGLIPDLGGVHRLARLVGPSRAKEIVWSTRIVESEEALLIGMVNRVVEPSDLLSEADALARQVMEHSPTAIALIKELVEAAEETSFEDELEREAGAQTMAIQGEHHREAVAAFLEGRPPTFAGS
jgi:enoyl-CoA hydratase/carnithine racemase